MMHPFAKYREDQAGRSRAKRVMKQAGGGIDAEESFPGGVSDVMQSVKAANDRKEVERGERFYDTGTRIPGRQKAKNDAYMDRLKKR